MENDSLNANGGGTLAGASFVPPSVLVADSAGSVLGSPGMQTPDLQASDSLGMQTPGMPTPEELGISIVAGARDQSGALLPMNFVVGDTFDFPVIVSWSVNGSALLVVPTSSANAKGILQLGVSQESSRAVKDGNEIAQIQFNFKLVAQDTGNLNIPVIRFEVPTNMGQPLEMRSESVPIRVDAPVSVMPAVVGAVVAILVICAGMLRMSRRKKKASEAAAKDACKEVLREKMEVLKQRVNVADSRSWLLELEGICKEYAAERFLLDAEKVNLEVLQKNGDLEGWEILLEEFAHARYGGGERDGYKNRETWKMAMKLMNLCEE